MAKMILLVDDEERLLALLKAYLAQEGFRVLTARNGREALLIARQEKPDLIVLDLMMPELDGYDFLRHHRKESSTPVIMLTARLEETDKVLGLELGADDYVTKPFSPRELTARIRAVLRRSDQPLAEPEMLRAADITLNRSRRLVKVGEYKVELTPTEFDLLAVLMRYPGRAFSRLELLTSLQGNDYEGYERAIDAHIKNLRAKIESDPRNPQYIETVFGVGYRFASEQ